MDEEDFLEDKFSIVVLYRAKKLFGDKAKYLRLARMVKLVTFVADDTDFDLTRGWYKYGVYSPNAYMMAKNYSDGDLISLEPPKELVEYGLEEFKERIPSIDESLNKWEPFFIQDQVSFYDWVYETKAPEKFKGLYKTHRNVEQIFPLLLTLRLSRTFQKHPYEKFEKLDMLITNYYNCLNHLKDDEILNLFCDFIDLFEMVLLRIKNKDYYVNEDSLIFLQGLKETYCTSEDSDCDLWTLLVPYSETLIGRRAEDEQKRYKSKVDFTKIVLPIKIENLRAQAESLDLLPSIEELEAEIKKYDSKEERIPLREIYATL